MPKLKSLEQLFKEKKGGFEIVGEVKGADMVGWAYDGPFDDLPAQHHVTATRTNLRGVVDARSGPRGSRGRDAHRVVRLEGRRRDRGHRHRSHRAGLRQGGLCTGQGTSACRPIAPLDEDRRFPPGFGDLCGKSRCSEPATADCILTDLQNRGVLFAIEKYPHRYPHCWRCKTELLFRLVDEWFINMSWREEIMTSSCR